MSQENTAQASVSCKGSCKVPYKLFAALRIVLGSVLLWAFIDKLFGLGFATTIEKAWISGGSPTAGFLKFAAKGPLVNLFHALAGNPVVDWLFMLGLLLIGLSLILGIGLKIAGYSGAVLMMLMWSALLFPENNPIIDEHIVYAIIFLIFTRLPVGEYWGFGKQWSKLNLVKQYPILK